MLFLCSLVFLVIFFPGIPALASDSAGDIYNNSLNETANKTGHANLALSNNTLADTIGSVIGAFLSILGVLFLVLMIYGGYIWMVSRGNEQEVNRARDLIKDAIIGFIIISIAYGVTFFVSSILVK